MVILNDGVYAKSTRTIYAIEDVAFQGWLCFLPLPRDSLNVFI